MHKSGFLLVLGLCLIVERVIFFIKVKPKRHISKKEFFGLSISRVINDLILILSLFSVLEIIIFLFMAKSYNGFYEPFTIYIEQGLVGFRGTILYTLFLLSSYFLSNLLKLFIDYRIANEFWNPRKNLRIWKISILFIVPIFLSIIISQSFMPGEVVNW